MSGRVLEKWMNFVLRFAAAYNLAAGTLMIFGTRICYRMIGMTEPDLNFPMKLVGILVALFGLGYYLVAKNPIENRNVLLLGMLSKGLGSVLGVYYVIRFSLGFKGLPWTFLPTLFVSDIIYLPLFAVILRRLYRLAEERDRAAKIQ